MTAEQLLVQNAEIHKVYYFCKEYITVMEVLMQYFISVNLIHGRSKSVKKHVWNIFCLCILFRNQIVHKPYITFEKADIISNPWKYGFPQYEGTKNFFIKAITHLTVFILYLFIRFYINKLSTLMQYNYINLF